MLTLCFVRLVLSARLFDIFNSGALPSFENIHHCADRDVRAVRELGCEGDDVRIHDSRVFVIHFVISVCRSAGYACFAQYIAYARRALFVKRQICQNIVCLIETSAAPIVEQNADVFESSSAFYGGVPECKFESGLIEAFCRPSAV